MGISSLLLLMLLISPLVAQELSEAMKLMQVSCDKGGQPKACFNLANMFLNINNQAEAERYFQRACKLEFEPACKKEVWKKAEPKIKKALPENHRSYLSSACKQLFQSIEKCQEFTCQQPNLLAPDTMVVHKVTGDGLNGMCKYSYTLNQQREMVCLLDSGARKSLRDRNEEEALEQISVFQTNGICNERDRDN